MLDGNKVTDINKISEYGKAKGFLLAKRYGLPTYSNFYIVENEKDLNELLIKFDSQNKFCMRSDTKIGNTPIGVGGRNGDRETIYEYLREIEQKSKELHTKGVAIIYWNNGRFCSTFETDGCFYLDFVTGKKLNIDYIGKGWDGSVLSHGTACHESYSIPWEDILFFSNKNRLQYRQKIIGNQQYNEQRRLRINEIHKRFNLSIEQCEKAIPETYLGINIDYFKQVINQVIVPMYDAPELQRYYKEYIPIAQIENGKILVPEVILPTRLKSKDIGESYEER